MKTEDEIRAKLDWLVNQKALGLFIDPCQRQKLDLQIATYKTVLGEGPDVILVPKPNVERSQLDQAGD